jgi:cytochrome P450
MCTGMALAQLEMSVVLATVLQRCQLEHPDQSTRPEQSGIAFRPQGGLVATVKSLALG